MTALDDVSTADAFGMAPTIAEAPAASLVSILGDLDQAREIGDQHVLAMRRAFYANGVISKDEAESLLSLDRRLTSQHTSWRQFLAEAVTDYIVHQEQPSGYVTAENSDWLVSQIASDGVVAEPQRHRSAGQGAGSGAVRSR